MRARPVRWPKPRRAASDYRIHKAYLETEEVVAQTALIRGGWLTHLAVNCHTDQLLGAVLTDSWNVERR